MKPKRLENRVIDLTAEIRNLLNESLPSGQTVIRPIRPRHPLSSQLIRDMLDEMKTDLQSIINSAGMKMSDFIDNTRPAIIQIENILRGKDLNTGRVNQSQSSDDHTTDWRLL